MKQVWACPRCRRTFRQTHQRHSCRVGSLEDLLQKKPAPLVKLYRALEKTLQSFGGVEFVAGERYLLFRTTRVFADLVFMRDALRLALLLNREAKDPLFFKAGSMSGRRIGHVAKIRTSAELRAVTAYLEEAYELAKSEERENAGRPGSIENRRRAQHGRSRRDT